MEHHHVSWEKPTISMVIFNSELLNYQRVWTGDTWCQLVQHWTHWPFISVHLQSVPFHHPSGLPKFHRPMWESWPKMKMAMGSLQENLQRLLVLVKKAARDEKWVGNWKCCVPRKTQWFCWSLSLLNGYFIGGIPHFQTYPIASPWFGMSFWLRHCWHSSALNQMSSNLA